MVSGDWRPACRHRCQPKPSRLWFHFSTRRIYTSSMIVPAVDAAFFQYTPTNTQMSMKVVGTLPIQMQAMTHLQLDVILLVSKLKLHRLPVSAQDIVLQPFLVQSGEEVDIKGVLLIPQKLIQPYCTVTKLPCLC